MPLVVEVEPERPSVLRELELHTVGGRGRPSVDRGEVVEQGESASSAAAATGRLIP
jgi:hypothetical protein